MHHFILVSIRNIQNFQSRQFPLSPEYHRRNESSSAAAKKGDENPDALSLSVKLDRNAPKNLQLPEKKKVASN